MSELVDQSKNQSYEATHLIGYALIFMGIFIWVTAFYSIFLSTLFMPKTGHLILDWVKDDMYYCNVVPSYCFLMVIIAYFNWSAMKYFRHAQ